MYRKMLFTVAMVSAFTGIARAEALDDITAALQKLADSPNYSWKTTIEGGFGAGDAALSVTCRGFGQIKWFIRPSRKSRMNQ